MSTKTLNRNSQPINIALWDTLGHGDFTFLRPTIYTNLGITGTHRIRPLVYPNTSVIVICFSLIDPISYEDVLMKWFPGTRQYCPGAPIILVGTKMNGRNDPTVLELLKQRRRSPIPRVEGVWLRKDINTVTYVECDAWTGIGVEQVFESAVDAVLQKRQIEKEIKLRRSSPPN